MTAKSGRATFFDAPYHANGAVPPFSPSKSIAGIYPGGGGRKYTLEQTGDTWTLYVTDSLMTGTADASFPAVTNERNRRFWEGR